MLALARLICPFLLALAAGPAVAVTAAEPTPAATSRAAAERELVAADASRASALVAGDLDALDRLLGEDLTYGHSNGQVQGKREFLDAIRAGRLRYLAFRPEDTVARLYGSAGIVTGRAAVEVELEGKPVSFSLRYAATFVRRDSAWVLVAYQSVRTP